MGVKERKVREKNTKRKLFIDVARELFFKNGYHNTSVQEIMEKAEFSKRTMYLYFSNKDELFLTIAEEGLIILRDMLYKSFKEHTETIEELIFNVAKTYINFYKQHREYFRINFFEVTKDMLKNTTNEQRKRLRKLERECLMVPVKIIERAVKEGLIPQVNIWEVACITWGACTGIILLSESGYEQALKGNSIEGMIMTMLNLVLRKKQETQNKR
jgi:AcrR family transcriptional regulator